MCSRSPDRTSSPAPTSRRGIARIIAVAGVLLLGVALASVATGVHRLTGPERPSDRDTAPTAARVLRVCADPNNLPFSNDRQEGFENRIASLLAREMGATLEYHWWAQRRGYVRNTIGSGTCDVLVGVPTGMDRVITTKSYYRSSYAIVTRARDGLRIESLDDPSLRRLRVGVQLVGDDYVNTPPAHALARRGIVDNVRGYSVQGDYARPNPPARVIDAVASGEIDVAVAWGPLAGYFAERESLPLSVVPLRAATDSGLPMAFDVSVGVRPGAVALRDTLDAILERRRSEIDRILDEYEVPRP
ncbi:MAG TPA: substrate-binding domain-containing protein [Gemmatimonadaceae bacterium]|jgi:mxaJ protein|nr:substrate-binding domain-containing protein [Gemmatimonadaceae bacterium]